MSSRVPIIRGNTLIPDFLPRGVETVDYSTFDPLLLQYPAAFTKGNLVEAMRVKQWQVDVDITFEQSDDPVLDLFWTPYTVGVSVGVMTTYADSLTNYIANGGVNGTTASREAIEDFELIANFSRDNRVPIVDTQGDVGPYVFYTAQSGTSGTQFQVKTAYQGTFYGTWLTAPRNAKFFTALAAFSNPLMGNQWDINGTDTADPLVFDSITELMYPFLRFDGSIAANIFGGFEGFGTTKFHTLDPSVGTLTILDVTCPIWRNNHIANYRSLAVSVNIQPLEYWPFQNTLGQDVFDTATGDPNIVGGLPVDPFA